MRLEPNTVVRDTRDLGPEVLLVDTRNGNQANTVSEREAFRAQKESGLDLVFISRGKKGVPVVKLMDFGKHQYELQKKARVERKKSAPTTKEYQFTCLIADHDINTKIKKIEKQLDDGGEAIIVVRANRRAGIPRGVSLRSLAQTDDFVLNRIIKKLGSKIKDVHVQVNEKQAFARLKRG